MTHMLTKNEEKLIKSLHKKKGRAETGLCLVEGEKLIKSAQKLIQFTFTEKDTKRFDSLITTQTPQSIAGVASIPTWTKEDVLEKKMVVVLDTVQDPGNVGGILRLCQAFDASLILIQSADPVSPKVLRSSAGAVFHIPWTQVDEYEFNELANEDKRAIYRLEKRPDSQKIKKAVKKPMFLIVGSEGQGIQLDTKGISIEIPHDTSLESLNVGHAAAIALHTLSN